MVRGARRSWILAAAALMLAGLACNMGTPGETRVEDLEDRPLVLLLAPLNGSVIAEGAEVALHAVAQESHAGVARIELRADDIPVGEVTGEGGSPSLAGVVMWRAAGVRGHLITAEAYRADGTSMGLNEVTVQVVEPPGGRPLPAASTPTPAATPSPQLEASPEPTPSVPAVVIPEGSPVARASGQALNLRQGPGTNYPPVGAMALGEGLPIVGRSVDGNWWAVAFGGGTAWVFAPLTTVEGDASNVPLVAAP